MTNAQSKHIHSMVRWAAASLLALLSCSGTSSSPAAEPAEPAAPTEPATDPEPAGPEPLREPNRPPDFEIPAYRSVGIGQEIAFGLEVIDEDQDDVRVELVERPESARFDPLTLTVVWKPTGRDVPLGLFKVRLTETQRGTDEKRVFEHSFSIDVGRRTPKPVAGPLSPEVETLITIHDPERLKLINRSLPLDKLLAHSAATKALDLPDEERAALARIDGKVLYYDVLRGLATANENPTVHPDTGAFDKKIWGDPRSWELIAVRPRLDKSWHELRLVYKAQRSPAATYVMFKMRPTSDENLPPEAREYNNKLFSKMVVEALFDAEGNLDRKLFTNKRLHAKQVEKLVLDIITYREGDRPWAHGTFLGLPSEARLGGGSKRNEDGSYKSGDAWAWNVMKVKPHDGRMTFVNVPIKGFAAAVKAGAAGWEMTCGSVFDPKSERRDERLTGLCRDTGHVDLPATSNGYGDSDEAPGTKIASSLVDATNMFRNHKEKLMTTDLDLRDPRRDIFEENGMTCSQCHVRKFGVRDMYDRTAYDPSAGAPTKMNKSQAPTFFVITPTERWQPYAIDFQEKQQCKFKKAIETDLGLKTSLECPLMAEPQ